MKWSKKTAQGFSPGRQYYGTRPERAAERVRICNIVREVFEGFSAVPSLFLWPSELMSGAAHLCTPVGRPFRALPVWGVYPGLKLWAVL
jgi:hypothetical protein